jgi:hypothetical protein
LGFGCVAHFRVLFAIQHKADSERIKPEAVMPVY